MEEQYIPLAGLPEQLGLNGNELLWIAGDLGRLTYAAIRHKEKLNAEGFLSLFESALPEGTLLIPAFNEPLHDGFENVPERRPSLQGSLTRVIWQKLFANGRYKRTGDAAHSFYVRGREADALCACNDRSSFGKESVFAYLHHHRGKMLLIDIDLQHSFTFAHYVEEMEQVPYRQMKTYRVRSRNDFLPGTTMLVEKDSCLYEKKPGYTIHLNGLEAIFLREGAAEKQILNGVPFLLIDLAAAYTLVENDIRRNEARNLVIFDRKLYLKQRIKSFLK